MEKKREICEYRNKLDKTLSCPELTNHESLKSLLRDQLCSSSQECNEDVLDKRTTDLSKLLSKLRSVSMVDHKDESSHSDWKLKDDHEDCRVMYREGLEGSPFHTLLAEGYIDGPIQDCLCVSWESTLYKKWWPQFAFPPFRILRSTCLQKVGIGEQICLVRMKVPWPLTDREIIVQYFLFEYFKDGLVVILLNTISDLDSLGVSFTENVIPESPDAVRMDIVGGFALQKVTSERSYFRTIGDIDIKLDLVPPSLINFISRQLIGNGFRLYKKSVASVAKFDEDYTRALADPLYTKIRQALYSSDEAIEEEPKLETNKVDASGNELIGCRTVPEIEEEDNIEGSFSSSDDENVASKTRIDINRRFCISPEVEQALGTLERVMYMVKNIKPVQETDESSRNRVEDQRKQVSFLESIENVVAQGSQRQESSQISEEEKQEKETGEKQDTEKKKKKKRKRKTHCFAFGSWL